MPTSKAPRSKAPGNTPSQRCQLCAARQVCLIGRLPRDRQERLDPLIREVEFRKGEPLQPQGAGLAVVRAIKLGTVMLTRRGPDEVNRPVALIGRGHLLGHWDLLGLRTAAGAQAISAGRVCEMPVGPLQAADLADPVFLDALHTNMAHTFARLADWGQVLRLRGLQRQLVSALLLLGEEQGSRTVRLPTHVALGALLGTSRESVARTLHQLEVDGHLLRIDRWHAELTPGHQAVFKDSQVSGR